MISESTTHRGESNRLCLMPPWPQVLLAEGAQPLVSETAPRGIMEPGAKTRCGNQFRLKFWKISQA